MIPRKSITIGNLRKKSKLAPNVDHVPIVDAGKIKMKSNNSSQRLSATYITTTLAKIDLDKR